jgi:hypothetical protein
VSERLTAPLSAATGAEMCCSRKNAMLSEMPHFDLPLGRRLKGKGSTCEREEEHCQELKSSESCATDIDFEQRETGLGKGHRRNDDLFRRLSSYA